MTNEQRYVAAMQECRMVICLTSCDYYKEQWCWTAYCPTGDLRSGVTDSASEAAVLAKYAIADYVDALVGVPR